MVNLEWYRSFIAIYRTGTVTAAAKIRCLTQPAMSQHIAALEVALKTRLFERSARRMIPTDNAQKLYPVVIAAIDRLEAIEHTPLGLSAKPWLRIGAPITYLYEQLLQAFFFNQMKDVRLDIIPGETPHLIEKLKANELDLVIATQKLSQPRLHYISLQQEQFVLVIPRKMKFAVSDTNDLQQIETWLGQQAWISYSAQMPIIRRFWLTLFNKRPDIEAQTIVPNLHAILRCIEMGQGISILPNYLLSGKQKNSRVQTPWTAPIAVYNTLYLACQQDRIKEPLIKMSISNIQEAIAKLH